MPKHAAPREAWATPAASAATMAVVGLLVAAVLTVLFVVQPGPDGTAAVDDTDNLAAQPTITTGAPSSEPSSEPSSAPSSTATTKPARIVKPPPVKKRPQKINPAGDALRKKVEKIRIGPTTFRVSSFNILGASHTVKGGRHANYASGAARLPLTVALLNGVGVSVAGLQEFQPSQIGQFRAIAPVWGIFPGPGYDRTSAANSIVWRTDVWTLVEAYRINVPYFGGRPVGMPYILLENIASGQKVWFFNTHNPADANGPAQRFRNAATAIQIGLANRLTADGTPVIFTGDMNDREEYFCPLTAQTEMHAANGGSTGPGCSPPPAMDVDWVFGSGQIAFSAFASVRQGLVQRASDHPFVWAEANIASSTLPVAEAGSG